MATQPSRTRRRRGRYASLAAYLTGTGTTQERLAAEVRTTQVQISRIAAGETMPRPALALRIAEHCRLPLESFARTYLARQARKRNRRPAVQATG